MKERSNSKSFSTMVISQAVGRRTMIEIKSAKNYDDNLFDILFEGTKGDTGERGKRGRDGAKGSKGDKGNTGAKGDKGDTAAKGNKGDTGAKGDRGDTGPRDQMELMQIWP
eukprot:TRINITY_DN5471_c0_g1_i11.p1 TRINITY_DN5471_c0_g1~~TRINITY_DN5471_c0_g1_i11.p1  ORF type:complete len:111 (+),score=32.09 TRINITY_DN5471_c0_g1_i11:123-455(+)